MEVVDVFPWLPPITTRVLFLEYSNKNSGYEYILIPSAFDLINSGLSFFACIPSMTASRSEFIFSSNQPSFSGRRPASESRVFDGSKMASSLPDITIFFF